MYATGRSKAGGPGVLLSVCLCGLNYGVLNVLNSFRAFSPRLSSEITTLGEEGAGLCASRAFVCLFCTC